MVRGACPSDHRHQRQTGESSSSAFGEITSSTHNVVVHVLLATCRDEAAQPFSTIIGGKVLCRRRKPPRGGLLCRRMLVIVGERCRASVVGLGVDVVLM
jgi:hypothetical protein